MSTSNTDRPAKHTAGALDIRNIIGGLLSVYGLILLFMGIFGDQESEKTGDINANLWAGIGLLVVGVIFLAWARIKPIVVPEDVHTDTADMQKPPA